MFEPLPLDPPITHEVHLKKLKIQLMVAKAVTSGTLSKHPCEKCGSIERLCAHHEDYSKPMDIHLLCASCHSRYHGARKTYSHLMTSDFFSHWIHPNGLNPLVYTRKIQIQPVLTGRRMVFTVIEREENEWLQIICDREGITSHQLASRVMNDYIARDKELNR